MIRQIIYRTIILIGIILPVSCKKNDTESKILIHGMVTDKYTKEPVQGAQVTLITDSNNFQHSQTTGNDGRYSMTVEKPEFSSYFKVVAYGYDVLEKEPFVDSQDDIKKVDFVLNPILLKFPFSASFEDPNCFYLENNTARYFYPVYLNQRVITVKANESQTICNLTKYVWKKGDQVIITVAGMSKTWTY